MEPDEAMSNHPVFSDDMREIVESFVVETQEIFDDLNSDLLRLEQAEDSLPLIDKIFRAVHTVKGTSGFLSLEQLNLLSHRFEDVLNRLRRREIAFHPGMMDIMFAAFDLMNVLLQQLFDSAIEPVPMDGLMDDLQRLARDGFPEDCGHSTEDTYRQHGHNGHPRTEGANGARVEACADEQAAHGGKDGRPASFITEFRPMAPADRARAASAAEDSARRATHADSVRVTVDRLDELLSLVGELVLSRNRLVSVLSDWDGRSDAIDRLAEIGAAASQIDTTTSRLQSAVMQTRMVPVGRVFTRFQRVVRELAKELHKEVELVIEGADTELDKSIVDEIGDPLLHLIRNAVDHGIEMPSDRIQRGKPACGRLLLRAEHDGGHILITLEDDGAGIDIDALRRRAARRGFAMDAEGAPENADNLVDLICKPGFSMNDRTTRISGRGMGMDVVKTAISRLSGDVQVKTEYGRGTRFTLHLPLTLAVMQCLLIESGEETYAVPVSRITEVVAVRDVTRIQGRPIIRLRDEIVPVVVVADAFGLPSVDQGGSYCVVVRQEGQRFGLVVDRLRGQEEVLVKPLSEFLKTMEGFSGSTILGDGRVVMVLDVGELIREDHARRTPGPSRVAASA